VLVDRWLAAHPANRSMITAAERAALPAVLDDGAPRVERAWRTVAATMRSDHYPSARRWWPVAALGAGAAAAVLLAGIVTHVGLGPLASGRRGAFPPREYATTRGQQLRVTLDDGSQVTLAPDSRLAIAYAGDGTTASRDVTLQGEAVFAVQHATQSPFIVHTRNATTAVLGTSFGVRGYPEDSAVRVVVREGRVSVNAVVLAAGGLVRVGPNGMVGHVQTGVSADSVLGWTHGILTFDGTPLRDVAIQLSRWYGVDFAISDPRIERYRLTITFQQRDPVETVMRVIAITTGATVERHGHTIVIAPGTRPVRATEMPATTALARSTPPVR
jgi:ferric-dicitrate binding protein FerR (iron transport regulator)